MWVRLCQVEIRECDCAVRWKNCDMLTARCAIMLRIAYANAANFHDQLDSGRSTPNPRVLLPLPPSINAILSAATSTQFLPELVCMPFGTGLRDYFTSAKPKTSAIDYAVDTKPSFGAGSIATIQMMCGSPTLFSTNGKDQGYHMN
jgi:hypothetical protein